jgi:uncharacterized protein with GYD domain
MSKYLIQVAYTPEAWAAMVENPQDRKEAVAPSLQSLGGEFVDAWFAFGEYDLIGVIELPDNVDAAAFGIAVAAKGACKAFRTTPLIEMSDGVEAMRKAQKVGYAAPKA